jgi:hypothetical protein
LEAVAVPAYLPLLTRVRSYRGKRRLSEVPLFGGYVFCAEEPFLGNPRIPVVVRKRVAQVLRPSDYDQLRDELVLVADVLSSRRLLQQRLFGQPGERVRIARGALQGAEGTIVRLEPQKRRIVLQITFLQIAVEVEVDEDVVEKI